MQEETVKSSENIGKIISNCIYNWQNQSFLDAFLFTLDNRRSCNWFEVSNTVIACEQVFDLGESREDTQNSTPRETRVRGTSYMESLIAG